MRTYFGAGGEWKGVGDNWEQASQENFYVGAEP